MSKEIAVSGGLVAIVDDEDYPELSRHRWSAAKNNRGEFYAYRNVKGILKYMHRVILQVPKGLEADHINGNGLDNRKANLRTCVRVQNLRNARKTTRKTSSKYKGVSRSGKRWKAQIRYGGQSYHLGRFRTEDDAARAYNKIATEQFGSFARLNEVLK